MQITKSLNYHKLILTIYFSMILRGRSFINYFDRRMKFGGPLFSTVSDTSQKINWYPGHIAKAERELTEYLKKVDVVIEVRDARIPLSTTHPLVPKWVGNKPLLVVMMRIDQVPLQSLDDWKKYYKYNPPHINGKNVHPKVFFVNGKDGHGTIALKQEALKVGIAINHKRKLKGMKPRPVRAAVIGKCNVFVICCTINSFLNLSYLWYALLTMQGFLMWVKVH